MMLSWMSAYFTQEDNQSRQGISRMLVVVSSVWGHLASGEKLKRIANFVLDIDERAPGPVV